MATSNNCQNAKKLQTLKDVLHSKPDSTLGFKNWPFSGEWGGVAFWHYGIKTALSTCHLLLGDLQMHQIEDISLSFIKYNEMVPTPPNFFFLLPDKTPEVWGLSCWKCGYLGNQMIEDIQEICWGRVYSNSFSFMMRSKRMRFYPVITDLQYTASYLCYFSSLQVASTKKLE